MKTAMAATHAVVGQTERGPSRRDMLEAVPEADHRRKLRMLLTGIEDTHEMNGIVCAPVALPETEWLAHRRRIFLKGMGRPQLFFSAHTPLSS